MGRKEKRKKKTSWFFFLPFSYLFLGYSPIIIMIIIFIYCMNICYLLYVENPEIKFYNI